MFGCEKKLRREKEMRVRRQIELRNRADLSNCFGMIKRDNNCLFFESIKKAYEPCHYYYLLYYLELAFSISSPPKSL